MKCSICPVTEGSCVGECPDSRGHCRQAESGDESQRQHLIGRSRFPCPGTPDAEFHPVVTPEQPVFPPLAYTLQRIKLMNACPHFIRRGEPRWDESKGAGCGCNQCALGKGRDGRVTALDCGECLGMPVYGPKEVSNGSTS